MQLAMRMRIASLKEHALLQDGTKFLTFNWIIAELYCEVFGWKRSCLKLFVTVSIITAARGYFQVGQNDVLT